MLVVTDTAKLELHGIVSTRSLSPMQCLRLTIPPKWTGEGDFGIVIDEPAPDDMVVAHAGTPVLRIEQPVAARLSRSMLDFKETPAGMGFALDVY